MYAIFLWSSWYQRRDHNKIHRLSVLSSKKRITTMRCHSLCGSILLQILFFLFIVHASAPCRESGFRLAPLIANDMVLQQQHDVPFWGRGMPGTEITVQSSWGVARAARVKTDSTWMLKLRTPGAGGPYRLVINHDDTSLTIANVLVGEVWLCSGQSNMEMPLAGWPPRDTVLNAAQEINRASIPGLRFCTIRREFSAVPESVCDAAWTECSPAAAPSFSAAAFFFGKRLHEALGVPVGLIHASWGGTPAESWISARYLSRLPRYDTTLKNLQESADTRRRMQEWLHRYPVLDMRERKGENRWKDLRFEDDQCPARSYDDTEWRTMQLPTVWEDTEMGNFDGVVWFRKQVKIPREWMGADLVLKLGPVDDIDVTYVNGARVGGHEGEGEWSVERVYRVPGNLVDSTVVEIAVRVIDYQGGGGIYGKPASMSLGPERSGESIGIGGEWKYVPVAALSGHSLFTLGPRGRVYESRPRFRTELSAHTPTALYNGMVAPLIPYAIRGVVWYQGEANTNEPQLYRILFPLLIENWRSEFGNGDFPFYYVQIAPFEYNAPAQSQYLREAQTAALAVKNTGMAVTLDIGNPQNIHPSNKKDVGERLALWALAKTYGRHIPYSGPLMKTFKKRKGCIELSFDHAGKGLRVRAGPRGNSFQIAGTDRVFRDALVTVRGATLIVSHPGIASPAAVRYAFSNAPEATLFNAEGLPAPSFRTDAWE
jgi:sialate O-acetylesterase